MRDLCSRRRRSSPHRPPGPQEAGFGGEVRGAQCAARPGERPVRADFTRQECAPPPPPPHGGRPPVSSAPRPRNTRSSATDSHNTVGDAGPAPTPRSAPRRRPRRSPSPSPRPERRLESPSVGEPPGPRGSGARRTSASQGGGDAGRRASRPIPRRQKAEEERRTALQHRRGTFSARARAACGTVAGGRFPELPSVTPAGPSQPGTNTATAILPRPRPQAPPLWPHPT